jgi:outer membrane protein OmpA-like peptidoglycan-associated protein
LLGGGPAASSAGIPADFGQVRVHTDARAAESASAVGALAYTVGQDIVFGAGQYQPQSTAGKRLLAHELAHVVQQGQGAAQVQRWADCTPARLSGQDCPPREAGEVRSARTSSMYFYSNFTDPASGSNGALVVNFDIGSATIKPGLRDNQDWKDFLTAVEANGSSWRLLGFSDCQGEDAANIQLRKDRAAAVANAFPAQIKSRVVSQEGAPLGDCITENSNASQRSFNRSVALIYDSSSVSFPDETVEATPPEFVCGPDVTSQVSAAVSAAGAAFSRWSSDEKGEACDALDSLSTGSCAWDIIDLHNNAWIYRNYRPICATQGADPPCGSSIEVGDECYYAGSANYVIFGKMCRLCADYYLSIPLINTGYARFTRNAMEALIDLYKGTGFTGLGTPSSNFRASVQWANAGYDGWPAGGTPPPGDKSNCAPLCPTPYSGPAFRVEWAPHMDPYNCS